MPKFKLLSSLLEWFVFIYEIIMQSCWLPSIIIKFYNGYPVVSCKLIPVYKSMCWIKLTYYYSCIHWRRFYSTLSATPEPSFLLNKFTLFSRWLRQLLMRILYRFIVQCLYRWVVLGWWLVALPICLVCVAASDVSDWDAHVFTHESGSWTVVLSLCRFHVWINNCIYLHTDWCE